MTTFVRQEDGSWRRDDERHDNVLIDTSKVPELLRAPWGRGDCLGFVRSGGATGRPRCCGRPEGRLAVVDRERAPLTSYCRWAYSDRHGIDCTALSPWTAPGRLLRIRTKQPCCAKSRVERDASVELRLFEITNL